MQRTRPMWNCKMTQTPNPRQTNSDISEDKPRRDCTWWKTIGGTERQMMKCKHMQTQATPNNSSELWRLYMGPHNLDLPLYYQLIDQHWARTKKEALREWWAEHLSNSLNRPSSVSTTALDQISQQSTQDDVIIHHHSLKLRWTPNEHQEKMETWLSCTKLQVQKQLGSSVISSVTSGNNRRCQKISEMPWLWPSTKIKAAKSTAETIGASHSCPLLGRFLPESSWISSSPSQKPICQELRVDFVQGVAWLTWFSQWDKSKRNA